MKLWDYQPIDPIELGNYVKDAKNKTLQAMKYKPFVLSDVRKQVETKFEQRDLVPEEYDMEYVTLD